MIWEAWMRFEGLNGSLEAEELAVTTITSAKGKVEKKRLQVSFVSRCDGTIY
jgi:hypothetical protein